MLGPFHGTCYHSLCISLYSSALPQVQHDKGPSQNQDQILLRKEEAKTWLHHQIEATKASPFPPLQCNACIQPTVQMPISL